MHVCTLGACTPASFSRPPVGRAALRPPGRALVDDPSSQAQLSAVPEGGPTEEDPPAPHLFLGSACSLCRVGPPQSRLAQLQGLGSGFVGVSWGFPE